MEKPTDKQLYALNKFGVDGTNLTKLEASKLIDGLKSNQPIEAALLPNKPITPKPTFPTKPKIDISSYYVAYAKDLCIALINMQTERMKLKPEEEIIAIDKLMDLAIYCVDLARNKLK